MPALWAGIKRTVGAAPKTTTKPITVNLMAAITAAAPPAPVKACVDRALLHCVRELVINPHDLAGTTGTVDSEGRVHLERPDDVRVLADGGPAAEALRVLIDGSPDAAWSFPQSREELAVRQAELLDRGGFPSGRRAHHLTELTELDIERCLIDPRAMLWSRDTAFLLLAWHACLEHGSWSPLRWDVDLTRTKAGWTVGVAGPGKPRIDLTVVPANDPHLCAVRALDRWRALSHGAPGALAFPSSIGSRSIPVGTQAASKRLKAALERAGHNSDGYATGSLPYGFIVTAIYNGAGADDIMIKARIGQRPADNHVNKVNAHRLAADRMRRLTGSGR